MANKFKDIGKIAINVNKDSSQEILLKMQDVKQYLQNNNIDTIVQKSSLEANIKIVFKIVDIGDISDKQMKEVFKILFSGDIRNNHNYCKLIDGDKQFLLPDDMDECLDWFIIE